MESTKGRVEKEIRDSVVFCVFDDERSRTRPIRLCNTHVCVCVCTSVCVLLVLKAKKATRPDGDHAGRATFFFHSFISIYAPLHWPAAGSIGSSIISGRHICPRA